MLGLIITGCLLLGFIDLSNTLALFQQNPILNGLLVCLAFILLDTIMGWIKALKEGAFSWATVPQFIKTNIFPYVGGLIILALFSMLVPELEAVYYIAVAAVSVKFGVEAIKEKMLSIF